MPVYVDELMEWGPTPNWPFKYACHMVADTLEELHEMAAKIGLKRSWYQRSPPHSTPHYDLTEAKRKQAIKAGAIPVEKDPDGANDCFRWWMRISRVRTMRWHRERQNGSTMEPARKGKA